MNGLEQGVVALLNDISDRLPTSGKPRVIEEPFTVADFHQLTIRLIDARDTARRNLEEFATNMQYQDTYLDTAAIALKTIGRIGTDDPTADLDRAVSIYEGFTRVAALTRNDLGKNFPLETREDQDFKGRVQELAYWSNVQTLDTFGKIELTPLARTFTGRRIEQLREQLYGTINSNAQQPQEMQRISG